MDFPKGVELVAERNKYYGYFDVQPATQAEVRQAINDRINAINNNTSKSLMPEQVLKKVSGTKPDSVVIVRRLIKTNRYGYEAGYKLEGYFWMEGQQYKFKSTASADPADLAETINEMTEIIDSATPIRANEIPTDTGFCMGQALMKGENEHGYFEKSYRRYRIAGHPDVTIEINFRMNFSDLSESLLTRADKMIFPELWQALLFRVKTLRKGKHPVGDIAGEEILQSIPEPNNIQVHIFTWDAVGKANNIWAPGMNIQLRSGNPPEGSSTSVRPSLNDKEAIELFDAIINSVRLRPTGPSAVIPSTPLGTLCRTGASCPQAGWWEAITPSDAIRDDPQYFAEGAIMPEKEIEFLRRYDWMTIKFGLRAQTMAVDWKLMAYPKEDKF